MEAGSAIRSLMMISPIYIDRLSRVSVMPQLAPPKTGVTVRMYRQGHGDCFLLATSKENGDPFYMVIDCGLWTGSEVNSDITIDKVVEDIADATGNHVDVLLI